MKATQNDCCKAVSSTPLLGTQALTMGVKMQLELLFSILLPLVKSVSQENQYWPISGTTKAAKVA